MLGVEGYSKEEEACLFPRLWRFEENCKRDLQSKQA